MVLLQGMVWAAAVGAAAAAMWMLLLMALLPLSDDTALQLFPTATAADLPMLPPLQGGSEAAEGRTPSAVCLTASCTPSCCCASLPSPALLTADVWLMTTWSAIAPARRARSMPSPSPGQAHGHSSTTWRAAVHLGPLQVKVGQRRLRSAKVVSQVHHAAGPTASRA